MSILQNASDSIVLGLEDYESSDKRRVISCTRNIYAGILLLYKHKLSELSPAGSNEVLLKQRILPVKNTSGDVKWLGKGKMTVSRQQIEQRFKSLNIVVDWKRVDRMAKFRNDVEHYYSPMSHDAMRALIAAAFVLISDFVRKHLYREPRDLFGADAWNVLTNVAEVYSMEKKRCTDRIQRVEWKFSILEKSLQDYLCPECASGLIDISDPSACREDISFKCLSCGVGWDFEAVAGAAVGEYLAYANFRSIKQGGEPLIEECPTCMRNSYIIEDNICVICEESIENECSRCYGEILIEEYDESGLCGWCQQMVSKDN